MKFSGFVGPTYKLDSVNVDCQRCVNLYPELIESGTGKEGQVAYLKSTPGLEEIFTVGTGPIRMVFADSPEINSYSPNNRLLIVSGSELYRASFVSGAWVTNKILDLWSSTGAVHCVARKLAPPPAEDSDIPGPGGSDPTPPGAVYTGTQFFMVDGEGRYEFYIAYNIDTPHDVASDFGATRVNLPEFIEAGVAVPTQVTWIDGFAIINSRNTNRFYISGWETFAFDALDFASAEGDPDNITAIHAMNRDLWLFNERSIEVWANTGNAAFPFERISGGFIEVGCAAADSVAKIGGSIFWLGRDQFGQGSVFAAQGLVPQRISTHAVEQSIQSYADISSARAYTYQSGGHSFYVLNFAEATWVYDLSTKLWHERAYTGEADLERHRLSCLAYVPALNLHIGGDYQSNKIYALKDTVKTDNGNPITRMRVSPHVSNSKKILFYHSFELDMETGVGLDGDVQGSDPQVMLDWSDDGGHTWSNEIWGSLGKKTGQIGQFKKRVRWTRLGRSYDRVFRIKITDPVRVNILGAELEIEGGNN